MTQNLRILGFNNADDVPLVTIFSANNGSYNETCFDQNGNHRDVNLASLEFLMKAFCLRLD